MPRLPSFNASKRYSRVLHSHSSPTRRLTYSRNENDASGSVASSWVPASKERSSNVRRRWRDPPTDSWFFIRLKIVYCWTEKKILTLLPMFAESCEIPKDDFDCFLNFISSLLPFVCLSGKNIDSATRIKTKTYKSLWIAFTPRRRRILIGISRGISTDWISAGGKNRRVQIRQYVADNWSRCCAREEHSPCIYVYWFYNTDGAAA